MSDRLEQIKGQIGDTKYSLVLDGEDASWLVEEVERLRKALEQIADDGVEGYESPQKRIALEALGRKRAE